MKNMIAKKDHFIYTKLHQIAFRENNNFDINALFAVHTNRTKDLSCNYMIISTLGANEIDEGLYCKLSYWQQIAFTTICAFKVGIYIETMCESKLCNHFLSHC